MAPNSGARCGLEQSRTCAVSGALYLMVECVLFSAELWQGGAEAEADRHSPIISLDAPSLAGSLGSSVLEALVQIPPLPL